MNNSLVLIAPVLSRSGYGTHARVVAKALINSGKFNVKIIPTPWGNTPQSVIPENDIKERLISQITEQPEFSVQMTIPSESQRIGKKSILITAGTESSIAPLSFVEGCNRVDLVIVPSNFTKTVLEQTKIEKRDKRTDQLIELIEVKTPIVVCFEGIDTNVFTGQSNEKLSELNLKTDFNFLFVGSWLQGNLGQDRKDVGMLIKVFYETFSKYPVDKQPGLILKTHGATFSNVDRDWILDKIKKIKQNFGNTKLPPLYLLHGDLTDDEMNCLYNDYRIKAMISFTKAEGFGLPLLEFTTTGKPVIASEYSGHLDFLNPNHSILLPGQLTKIDGSAANDWIVRDAEWFTVSYPMASNIMQKVFNEYGTFLNKCKPHAQITKEQFSIEKMQEKLVDILGQFSIEQPKTFKLPQLKKIK